MSRRRPRRLGPVVITYHALDSYLNRVPGVSVHAAKQQIQRLACRAVWDRSTWSGAQVYRAGDVELLAHPVARRSAILVTIVFRGGPRV